MAVTSTARFPRALTRLVLISSAVWWSSQALAAELDFGMTGQAQFADAASPFRFLPREEVKALVLAAATGNLTEEDASGRLAGTETRLSELVQAGLLKIEAGRAKVDFNLFTAQDQRLIRDFAAIASRDLALQFLRDREIRVLLDQHRQVGISSEQVAFALIGCVVLDWDGLALTRSGGFRSAGRRRPDGTYVIWARESAPDLTTFGVYWGGRDVKADEVHLSSLGDSYAERRSFPDVAWPIKAGPESVPEGLRTFIQPEMNLGITAAQRAAGRFMMELRSGPKSLEEVARSLNIGVIEAERIAGMLTSLRYVQQDHDRYRSLVPIFTREDGPRISAIRSAGRRIMTRWLQANMPKTRRELSQLSALKAGVPFEELYTDIWHDLFGWTNYRLVQSEMFHNPYGPGSRHYGYYPFVWSAALDLKSE